MPLSVFLQDWGMVNISFEEFFMFKKLLNKAIEYRRFSDVCEKIGVTAFVGGIIQICLDQSNTLVVLLTLFGCSCVTMSIVLDMLAGRK